MKFILSLMCSYISLTLIGYGFTWLIEKPFDIWAFPHFITSLWDNWYTTTRLDYFISGIGTFMVGVIYSLGVGGFYQLFTYKQNKNEYYEE